MLIFITEINEVNEINEINGRTVINERTHFISFISVAQGAGVE